MPAAKSNQATVRRPIFRSALVLNLALALLLTAAAVAAAYFAVGKGVEASARADIEADIRVLDQHGELHEGFGYSNAINFRILPHEDAKEITLSVQEAPVATPSLSVYLVLRRDGSAVVGNLKGLPDHLPLTSSWVQFDGAEAGAAPGAIIAKIKGVQRNRYFLVVGRRLATYDALYQSFIPMMVLIALAMTGLSAFMISVVARRYGRRVAILNGVFQNIRQGDIQARIQATELAQQDELSLLGQEINTALDEISRLLHGLDAVSQTAAHELNKEVSQLQKLAQEAADSKIKIAADALQSLLREILELAKIGSASAYTMHHIALDECVDEAVTLYQDAFEDKGVDLRWAPCCHPTTILGRASLVTNLIANLLDNALKHTPASGSVEVRVESDDKAVRLIVRDTGPGTASEDISELIAGGVKGSVAGYGFGLRFVQAVAIRHGARVLLQNSQPGLRVMVQFPAI